MCLIASDRPEGKRYARAVAAGRLLQPVPRLFVRSEYWDILDEPDRVLHCMRSLQVLHPNWVFVGSSAALIYGLQIPLTKEYLWPIRIAARWGSRGRSTPAVMRQVVEGDENSVIDHLRVTSLERTAFDCMREMSFADGLAVADSALAISGKTREQMINGMNEFRRTSRGGRHAMEAASYADGRASDRDESRVRAVIIENGFEVPTPNPEELVVDGKQVPCAMGWHFDDGAWLALQLSGKRSKDALPIDIPGVRQLTLPCGISDDPEMLVKRLIASGVPRASEPPAIGKAKAFKPVRQELGANDE